MSGKADPKGVLPAGHRYMRDSILDSGNIFGFGGPRTAWATGLDLPRQAEYHLFAGCGYQFARYGQGLTGLVSRTRRIGMDLDRSLRLAGAFKKAGINLANVAGKVTAAGKEDVFSRVLVSSVSVLRKLGVDLGYLYEQEPCCGSPLYYSGFVAEYAEQARQNYELFKKLGVKKIVGLPSPCAASLRTVYPKFIDGYDIEVRHFIEIVAGKLKAGGVKLKLKEPLKVTYHDPCQLSRYLNIVDEPRAVLHAIEGLELREPPAEQRGKWSACCGGGGLELAAPDLCDRIAERRVRELLATGVDTIVTNCPGCMMQLMKGIKKVKANARVVDISEIVDKAL